jgi:hypothetical protein
MARQTTFSNDHSFSGESTMRVAFDNRAKRAGAASSEVNLGDEFEVRYWTATLGVSSAQLAEAVRRVGTSIADLRRELSTEGQMG